MDARELREMDKEALLRRAEALQSELLTLREAVRSGKEKNHRKLRNVRRQLARARTLLK